MNPEIFDLTKRGLRVFPLAPGSKIPPRGSDWTNTATADAFQAYDDFVGVPGANVGVLANGLVIVDADTKNGDGISEALALIGDVKTYTVTTPSGGRHFYFDAGGELFNNAVRIRPNVDIRAANGYVVGPGSQIGGKRYSELDTSPIAPLPASIRALLTAKRDAAPVEARTAGELDTAGAIASATAYLKAAPLAIQGDGGDNQTIRVANRVMDFGVSPATAVELMADHWNERCSPPWEYEDLERKVFSAAKSKQDAIGRDNPNNFFEDVEPPPAPVDDFASSFVPLEMSEDDARTLPPRPWLVEDWLLKGKVTELVAPGGVGKSALSIGIAVSVALGEGSHLGVDVREGGRVLIVNVEDDVIEMRKRLYAFQKLHGIAGDALRGKIDIFDSERDWKVLVDSSREGPRQTAVVGRLIDFIKRGDYRLVIFDPLVEMHSVNENDNGQMAFVMNAFKTAARSANVAVMLSHHTSKPPKADSTGRAGNAATSRGASSIGNAARVAMTMFAMTEPEARTLKVPEDQRYRYVRIDGAKANLNPLTGASKWFEKVNVPLGNGEGAPAFKPAVFDFLNVGRASSEQVAAVLGFIVEISGNGGWRHYSASPKARNFLPRSIAAMAAFAAIGITEAVCLDALETLLRQNAIERAPDGRAKTKCGDPPLRYRATVATSD